MNMTNEEARVKIDELLKSVNAKVKFKENSFLMKLISIIVYPFNKRFMTAYTNVIFRSIWFPSVSEYKTALEKDPKWLLSFLSHECSHVNSYNKLGLFGMVITYGLPQILALPMLLVTILTFIFSSWVNGLIALFVMLLFLCPLPAFFRVKEEVLAESYESMVKTSLNIPTDEDNLFKNICSWEYYNPLYAIKWAKKQYESEYKRVKEKLSSNTTSLNDFEKFIKTLVIEDEKS